MVQREMWKWYAKTLAELQPIDILIGNGDLIEGCGSKSGGTELITRDRNEQVKMAVRLIQEAKAEKNCLLRGSNGHAGAEEDWEDHVASELGCDIGDHRFFDINGLVFDVKHNTNGGSVPSSKGQGILMDAMWNLVWSEKEAGQPKANVFVRSHLHFYHDCVGVIPGSRCFITPALQAAGTKFGERYCRRVVDVGMISFDIQDERRWSWTAHIAELRTAAAILERL
jgi:hypothetical protein